MKWVKFVMITEKIYQIEFEVTTKCNAKCPQCVRNYHGDYTWPSLPIIDLDIKSTFKNIPSSVWKELGHIRFCGTYGDPCMRKDLIDIIRLTKSVTDASISISTNGSIRSTKWWEELATVLDPTKDSVTFGIDGLEDTNHLYRIGTSYKKIISNLKAFNQAGGASFWSFLVFEHNQHQVDHAREFSKQIGCRNFTWTSTSRFLNKQHKLVDHTPVFKDGKIIYSLKPTTLSEYVNTGYEELQQFKYSQAAYEEYLNDVEVDCFVKRRQKIYVSAEGEVFPCGWLADRLYGYDAEQHQDHKTILDLISSIGRDKINLYYTNLLDITQGVWFNTIEETWKTNKIQRCAAMCDKNSNLIQQSNKNVISIIVEK